MAKKTLKDYFPMIRSRREVLNEIRKQPELLRNFNSWKVTHQEEFLDLCCGVKGIKMTYDGIFKELMNPEIHPERLECFLSLVLGSQVKIFAVLPNDTTRIGGEAALLIQDILLELEDHRLVNLEIQKIAIDFPAERAGCYSSDLMMRQYKMVKGERGKDFTYRDIKKVYTVLLLEDSTPALRAIPDRYIHHSRQIFDTGLEFNLPQEFFLISLDIYKKNMQYKHIEAELDAWLAFFSFDNPERIIELIRVDSRFKAMYEEMFNICRNIEGVMNMFSQELYELDRNTFRYMIATRDEKLAEMHEQIEELTKRNEQLVAKDAMLKQQEAEILQLKQMLAQKQEKA